MSDAGVAAWTRVQLPATSRTQLSADAIAWPGPGATVLAMNKTGDEATTCDDPAQQLLTGWRIRSTHILTRLCAWRPPAPYGKP